MAEVAQQEEYVQGGGLGQVRQLSLAQAGRRRVGAIRNSLARTWPPQINIYLFPSIHPQPSHRPSPLPLSPAYLPCTTPPR